MTPTTAPNPCFAGRRSRHRPGGYPPGTGTCQDIQVVAEAGDGEAAQTLIQQHQPDVAVLDIQMPKASGIEGDPLGAREPQRCRGPGADRL